MSADSARIEKLEWAVRSLGARLATLTGDAGDVASVFGRTGAVVAATNDYTWAQVDKTTSSLADITTRAESDLTFTDITTNDASTTQHGFLKKLPNQATQYLDGTGTFAQVTDADLSLSDITTNNASASAHGFVPKWPNNTTTFFRGDGTYAAPAAGGGNWSLVEEEDITVATQNVDFSTALVGDTARAYLIEGRIVNGEVTNAADVVIRINTATLAWTRNLQRAINSAWAVQEDTGTSILSITAGQVATFWIYIHAAIDETRHILSFGAQNETTGIECWQTQGHVTTPTAATSITSLGLGTNQASGIGVESTFRLYKAI